MLILINGEEEFLMECMARDEAELSLAPIIKTFRAEDIQEYLEESSLETLSNEYRAFIIKNVSEIPPLPVGAKDVLIVISNLKKKLDDPRAKRIHNFPKFKTYDDKNELINWIIKEGDNRNIDLRRVASALFVNSGKSPRKISSEIEKLSIITPPDEMVTPEVARSVMVFSADLTPKSIVDSVCDGNVMVALSYYDKLQELNNETGWIIAYLYRHVFQQLQLEQLVRSNTSSQSGAETLGVHPFVYKKLCESRIGLWTDTSLIQSINILADLDISHKRGDEAVAKFGLESEIIRLCEEAKNGKRS